ncbi:MAG TPA: adenylate/guanylate cyclase domain-containing protein [Acidimicrobiales bacterium]|nr:adenylate/guanylate cyclase domain-containing protein [Acidimicrobiales bacterium]
MRGLPRSATEPPGAQALLLFGSANLIGGVVVFLYLTISGQESVTEVQDDLGRGLIVFGVYLAASGFAATVLGIRAVRVLDWWYEGRKPTADERIATLLLPRRFMVLSLWAWSGGATVFLISGIVVGETVQDTTRTALGTMLGAATTSGTCYLLVDRVLRPQFAHVLREGPMPITTLSVRLRMAVAWWLGSGIPLLAIATSPIDPEESLTDLAVLAGIGFVAGSILIAIATRTVSDRLASVRSALGRVQAGDLSVEVPVDEAGEVGLLQAGVNSMVHGLRERQVIADLFGRHVGDEVAKRALEEGVSLGGEQRDVSVLFLDVMGSTWLAATRPASEVVSMLNALFSVVVRVVAEEDGWVDKFEGDGVLCVWGAPAPLRDHPTAALRCARRLCEEVGTLARSRHPDLDVGIGVSSGFVVAGNIGSEQRFEYTVIGDPVNEAARLTEAAKMRPGRVLAAARCVERAADDERCAWVAADVLPLRGRPEATPTFEPRTLVRPSGA